MSDLFWAYSLDEIEKIIKEQVANLGDKLDHMQITWAETNTSFLLWLQPIPVAGFFVEPANGHNWSIKTIAYISKYESGDYCHDNFTALINAGRKLYFQLRKKFPVKRDLSVS